MISPIMPYACTFVWGASSLSPYGKWMGLTQPELSAILGMNINVFISYTWKTHALFQFSKRG